MAMGLGCNYVIPMVYWEGTVLTTVIQLLPSVCGLNGALDWGEASHGTEEQGFIVPNDSGILDQTAAQG